MHGYNDVEQVVLVAPFAAPFSFGSSIAAQVSHGARQRLAHGNDQYWALVQGSGFQYSGVKRTYYVQAEEVVWDYAPQGLNVIGNAPFAGDELIYTTRGEEHIGSKYLKCLYVGYKDATFTKPLPQPATLGFLGPILRAAVGDAIEVVFKNTCTFPASVHPHGVRYSKAGEGAPYFDNTSPKFKGDDFVETGSLYTYKWIVPDDAGPGPGDAGSSVMWMYHSHVNEPRDTYSGLLGGIIVTSREQALPDGTPRDVDTEHYVVWSVVNENLSWYIDHNAEGIARGEDFEESNLKHSINGYVFGNGPVFSMCANQRVRWYDVSVGSEVDVHTPHWHGNTLLIPGGIRSDVVTLGSATFSVADMVPTNVGTWLLHCHVNDHIFAGMLARFEVNVCK